MVTPTVKLSGTASIHQQVQILDGGNEMAKVRADANGNWETTYLPVSTKRYEVKVRGLYGNPNPESGTRIFTVISGDISGYAPSVLEARGNNGKLLRIDDYYRLSSATVEVPVFPGMAANKGQTVGIKWKGRVDYDSEIKNVVSVTPMTFSVPRMEFIDSIGRTVPVTFSVKRGSGPIETSGALQLMVEGQRLTLPQPTITADRTKVTVRYTGMAPGIPADWIRESRGHTVLVNYAVGTWGAEPFYMFSQVLRIQVQ
ncbi:hypothetical protein BGV47_31890 [Burkholderia ubonensis]|uniref:hypothetical protein n=1 Tax=Burkholderia ubonensis TaxID=101571 RepID=UPI00091B213A|nr:hypothetical protein [Burkholderia ubonensis]OJA24162.1 hypothetical protein BGV47_31890 [Burkholderia ubonensis]